MRRRELLPWTRVVLALLAWSLELGVAPSAQTNPVGPKVWVLDDAGSDLEDTLTILDPRTGDVITSSAGVGAVVTVGNQRTLAASIDGSSAYVCSHGYGDVEASDPRQIVWRLTKVDRFLHPQWSSRIPRISAITASRNGYLYGLNFRDILAIDPIDGRVVGRAPAAGGIDLVVDERARAVWVVGRDVKKFTLDLQLIFVVDPIIWYASSVDYRSDGSVWVAARSHDRLLHIGADGSLLRSVYPGNSPSAVRVDRNDDSVWVAAPYPLYSSPVVRKFDRFGNLLLSLSRPASSVHVDQTDGSVWIAGYTGTLEHMTRDGIPLSTTPGFSTSTAWIVMGPGVVDHRVSDTPRRESSR